MSTLAAPVRRRIGRALRNSTAMREASKRLARAEARDDAAQRQLVRQQQQLDRAVKQEQALRSTVGEQAKKIDALTETLTDLQAKLRPFERANSIRDTDNLRLSSQVEALEQRLADLDDRPSGGPVESDPASTAEARRLIDEVRREHEQIRVRMQIISWYEERLRRVEASVTSLYDGDVRHPV